MTEIFKTVNGRLEKINSFEEGCWINLVNPSQQELIAVEAICGVLPEFLQAALDDEERSRIDYDDEVNQTLITVDIPKVEADGDSYIYTTIPLGIINLESCLITVCLISSSLTKEFIEERVRYHSTQKRSRFVFQLLYQNARRYLNYLRQIDKETEKIHQELQRSYKNKELLELMRLEKSLVYFSTSLRSNEVVLERLMRTDLVRKYPDDTELLEDVITENKQAIEMCTIYRDILSGTMDAYASIISNNLNIVMRFLAAITIVLTVPQVISGIWGMNVNLPFQNDPLGFIYVCIIALVFILFSTVWLYRREMFK